MSEPPPRLRMFAGPNGSGKSALKSYLPARLLGIYLNPDEIEQEIRNQGFLDFSTYGLEATAEGVLPFFIESRFLQETGHSEAARQFVFANGRATKGYSIRSRQNFVPPWFIFIF